MTQTRDLIKKMAEFFGSEEYYEKGEDARLELSPEDVRCMNRLIHTVNLVNSSSENPTLPKGHGRLCDMDELVKNIVKEYGVNSIHELPQDIKMFYDKFINSAPIILDTTFDYKLKNYAFFRKEEEK